ncbi:MAG: TetR/AcrR family transcriptional regulator [Candidatus Pristimantibacillus sp.]
MDLKKERRDVIKYRRTILQSAEALFLEHGVDKVTMRNIATTAGIGQGTLYRHYAHKGEICQDLMKGSSEEFIAEVSDYLDNNNGDSLQKQLQETVHYCVDFIDKHSNWLVYIQAPSCEERQQMMYQSPIYVFLYQKFYKLIEEVQSHDESKDKDTGFRVDAMLASIAPEFYVFTKENRGLNKNEIIQKVVRLYIDPLFNV